MKISRKLTKNQLRGDEEKLKELLKGDNRQLVFKFVYQNTKNKRLKIKILQRFGSYMWHENYALLCCYGIYGKMLERLRDFTDVEIISPIPKRGIWSNIEKTKGVYVIFNNENIQYVGRSNNLYQRLLNHYSSGGMLNAIEWDRIRVIYSDDNSLLELCLIDTLLPNYNGTGICCEINPKSLLDVSTQKLK